MSGGGMFSNLKKRYTEIQAELDRAETDKASVERSRVREEIVTLYRDAEQLIEQLEEFREEIRPLVDRYKAIFRSSGNDAPASLVPIPARRTSHTAALAAVRIDHLGASTFVERGWNAIAGANFDQAVLELKRAVELSPGSSRTEALLGWAHMRLGQYPEARSVLEAVLAREPDHPLARANLGYVCLREGRIDEALEHLTEVQGTATDRTARLYANLYLGMAHAEREQYAEARSFFQQALEMSPNLIEAYWELGRSHFLEGSVEPALAAWKQGADANPFNLWGELCAQAVARMDAGEAPSLG